MPTRLWILYGREGRGRQHGHMQYIRARYPQCLEVVLQTAVVAVARFGEECFGKSKRLITTKDIAVNIERQEQCLCQTGWVAWKF